MKPVKFILAFFFFTMAITNVVAQKKEERIITEVTFEKDKIILNRKEAFGYRKEGNYFEITDLEGNVLISAKISPIGDGKFKSRIFFATLQEQFYNEKIVARNELIFALCDNNVITKDLKLDEKRLSLFIKTYNQLEDPPSGE